MKLRHKTSKKHQFSPIKFVQIHRYQTQHGRSGNSVAIIKAWLPMVGLMRLRRLQRKMVFLDKSEVF